MNTKLGETPRLVSDAEVARLLSVSRSWVRKERFNRRHGHPHTLSLEPVILGSIPRYRFQEVLAWIDGLGSDEQEGGAP